MKIMNLTISFIYCRNPIASITIGSQLKVNPQIIYAQNNTIESSNISLEKVWENPIQLES
jgi:hypothetical protein